MAGAQTLRRYHTNDSGKTLPCIAADVRKCRFIHGATPDEAAENWQQQMADKLIPAAEVPELSADEKLQQFRRTALKHMDTRDLAEAILLEAAALGMDGQKVATAIALASELHSNQFRKGNRGELANPPYIEHPLRNALRLIRLGCEDEPTIIGEILHDTVEDGSSVFVKARGWSNRRSRNEHAARAELTIHIEDTFGTETREIVIAVTNEISEGDPRTQTVEEKHRIYVGHLRAQVLHSPKAFLVKMSDFIDNATGLYHGVGSLDPVKLKNQATKYLLSIPVFQEGLDTLNLPIPVHSRELLQRSLIETERRLRRIIAGWDGSGKI